MDSFNKKAESVKKTAKSIQQAFNPNDISGLKINNKPFEDYILKIKGAKTELSKFSKIKNAKTPQINTENLENATQKIKESTEKIEPASNRFNKVIDKIKNGFNSINSKKIEIDVEDAEVDLLKYKISELEEKLQNAGKLHLSTKEIVETRAKLAMLNSEYDKLINKEDESSSKGKNTFNSLNNGIGKSISKIKRLVLSFISISTVYSLLSRASSAYLSTDTSLANKLQAVWVGLGAILEPVISRIVNVMLKAVKYINIFIKALTGVDLLAKATNKSLNGTTKSAKALSKTLAGFDELTNLDTTSDVSLGNIFKDVEINPAVAQSVENFALKIKELKSAWDDLDPSIQNIIKLLGIGGILGILTGKPGLIIGVSALILGIDGLCKIFDNDLTNSAIGLMELLGAAGLIGLLTGNAGLTMAIASVVLALFRIK